MLLTSAPDQTIRSPIRSVTANDSKRALVDALDSGVALADWTGRQLFILHSTGAEAFPAAMRMASHPVGTLIEGEGIWTARMTDEKYWLIVPTMAGSLPQNIQEQSHPGLVSFTDISHGVAIILVAGSKSKSILRNVCGLNFSDQTMADKCTAQTSIAKVRGTIIRRDWKNSPAYLIIVDRSVGRYVWEVMLEAGREFRMLQFEGALFPGNDSNV